jgi:hypothetical protein
MLVGFDLKGRLHWGLFQPTIRVVMALKTSAKRCPETSRMKAFICSLVIAELLGGCSRKPTTDFIPDHRGWFIRSWDHGVFTIHSEGITYEATCDGTSSSDKGHSLFVSSDGRTESDGGESYSGSPPKCDLTIGLVGHDVEAFEPTLLPAGGKRKGADGWIVTMVHSGTSLMLQCWRDKDTQRTEGLKILSATTTHR